MTKSRMFRALTLIGTGAAALTMTACSSTEGPTIAQQYNHNGVFKTQCDQFCRSDCQGGNGVVTLEELYSGKYSFTERQELIAQLSGTENDPFVMYNEAVAQAEQDKLNAVYPTDNDGSSFATVPTE